MNQTITRLAMLVGLAGLGAPALVAQSPAGPSVRSSHPKTCANGLQRYATFSEIKVPYDTLTMPGLSGSFGSREEMEAARLASMAGIGATGYVIEEKSESDPGSPIVRTMTRTIPVFVPADAARVRAACAASNHPSR
jgi:hypothetical protein